ncbi:shugoshin [Neurospora sp. IMI 360204]|nr:shugoshin [Neurospora sp. IMI 360204]
MARLKEQAMSSVSSSTDNLELLRRKFLRQNRDIARVNSTQSLRIRGLENECARLLSENLELRGHVLRLEKELQDNAAQRVADHALEVKAKMETQLAELSSLLASLGEPPSKRRPSEERRYAQPRPSVHRSPPLRRARQEADQELLAEQEGRLPPIYENKTYARATMNSEEILALCMQADDSNDSPDIGPPPVSRFVEDDMVIPRSPSPNKNSEIEETEATEQVEESPRGLQVPPSLSPPKLNYDRRPNMILFSPPKESRIAEPTKMSSPLQMEPPKQSASAVPSETVRAGLKRKFSDENENEPNKATKLQPGKDSGNTTGKKKGLSARDPQKRKSIKETATKPRAPLSAKSTNEHIASPKKATKAHEVDDGFKPVKVHKAQKDKEKADLPLPEENPAVEEAQGTSTSAFTKIEIRPPALEPTPEVAEIPEADILITPGTPERASGSTVVTHDTPPPAHISSNGETSRPSRRARAAISYTEPNLRDKMRRPTKELFDAVSGEGKFIHRPATQQQQQRKGDESAPTSVSKVKAEPSPVVDMSGLSSSTLFEMEKEKESHQEEGILSPTGILPSSVDLGRRRRASSFSTTAAAMTIPPVREQPTPNPPAAEEMDEDAAVEAQIQKELSNSVTTRPRGGKGRQSMSRSAPTIPTEKQEDVQLAMNPASVDLYDFASCVSPDTAAPQEEANTGDVSGNKKAPRGPRRASSAASTETTATASVKPRSSRKRASMLVPKKSLWAEEQPQEEDEEEDVGNDSGGSLSKGRASRRRSMML